MEHTGHYGLKKPGAEDFYKVSDFNENAEAIDAALHGLETGKAALGADGKVPAAQLPEMDYEAPIKDAPAKDTPADADGVILVDAADQKTKKLLWSRVKAVLKGWFDTLYAAVGHTHTAAQVGAIPANQKGAAGGVAELDSGGKVPAGQLPSYVDDVLEFASLSAFPSVGESGKIYVSQDTNKTYRWSGSGYVEISQGVALGETSSTAYRGDRGKIAYDHSQATGNPHGTTPAQIGAAPASHTHGAGDISSGTFSSDRLPTVPVSKGGTGATTAAAALAALGAAAKSTQLSKTISTTWGGSAGAWTQVISVAGVTATNIVEVFLAKGATDAQEKAYTALQLRDGGQAAGQITLLAKGTKNTVNIPITVIVRGDL